MCLSLCVLFRRAPGRILGLVFSGIYLLCDIFLECPDTLIFSSSSRSVPPECNACCCVCVRACVRVGVSARKHQGTSSDSLSYLMKAKGRKRTPF